MLRNYSELKERLACEQTWFIVEALLQKASCDDAQMTAVSDLIVVKKPKVETKIASSEAKAVIPDVIKAGGQEVTTILKASEGQSQTEHNWYENWEREKSV